MRGKAKKADILVGVCYRPPKQDEESDKIFCKQLRKVSQSLTLVLLGDFCSPDVWKQKKMVFAIIKLHIFGDCPAVYQDIFAGPLCL